MNQFSGDEIRKSFSVGRFFGGARESCFRYSAMKIDIFSGTALPFERQIQAEKPHLDSFFPGRKVVIYPINPHIVTLRKSLGFFFPDITILPSKGYDKIRSTTPKDRVFIIQSTVA